MIDLHGNVVTPSWCCQCKPPRGGPGGTCHWCGLIVPVPMPRSMRKPEREPAPKVRRWEVASDNTTFMEATATGLYVTYDDYAALEQENTRLRESGSIEQEIHRLRQLCVVRVLCGRCGKSYSYNRADDPNCSGDYGHNDCGRAAREPGSPHGEAQKGAGE